MKSTKATDCYFCLRLTEDEHLIVEADIRDWASKNGAKVVYYRKLKRGHVPLFREVKVAAPNLGPFKKFLRDSKISLYIQPIPDQARP